jgi:hypothetical protein
MNKEGLSCWCKDITDVNTKDVYTVHKCIYTINTPDAYNNI